jgi:hypothetical protein
MDREDDAMCLTCGCMDAHLKMGEHNIRYEDIEAAAHENGRSVAETWDVIERTRARDTADHPSEYAGSAETSA